MRYGIVLFCIGSFAACGGNHGDGTEADAPDIPGEADVQDGDPAETESCSILRACNVCPEPGLGTKYCSELIWWSYGGFDGEHAGGSLPAGKTGSVPDLFNHTTSVMTTISHTSNDLALNFDLKCREAMIADLRLVDAVCP